ncbi:DUF2306 domain-containing protein [Phenylobacterium sp.]|uniref:DUF2306 domain-containing protein n=1 Tax=Phenylobacterium sp. TaxID=1871053 RepID=UPI00391B1F38
MSPVSQTPARGRDASRWALAFGFTAAILLIVMTPARELVFRAARSGRLHAPDLAFLAGLSPAIKVHLAAALAALVLGAVLMAARKGRTFHRTAGWAWVALVAVTAGSTLFITSLNHGRWSLLHLFTGWTLIVLPLAVFWARRHQVMKHRRHMMGLFYGGFAINLFIAFIPGRALWRVFFG